MNDDWDERPEIKLEGFGLKPPKPLPETLARRAVPQHTKVMAELGGLELLMFPIGKKKDRQVIQFLYRNADATVAKLSDFLEEEPLTDDALRKTIERLNDLFEEAGIPLRVSKERGGTGFERVWLDVRH